MASPEPTTMTSGRTIGLITSPPTVRIAQTLGLTLSFFAAGQSLSLSLSTVPAILRSPAPLLLQQWRRSSRDVKLTTTVSNIFSTVSMTWLAFQEPTWSSLSFYCYSAGAIMAMTSLNFGIFGLAGTERQLSRRTVQAEEAGHAEKGGIQIKDEQADTIGAFMSRNIKTLGDATDGMSVHQLVDRWAFLNLVRAGLMSLGAVTALWGVVCNDLSVFELFELAMPAPTTFAFDA